MKEQMDGDLQREPPVQGQEAKMARLKGVKVG